MAKLTQKEKEQLEYLQSRIVTMQLNDRRIEQKKEDFRAAYKTYKAGLAPLHASRKQVKEYLALAPGIDNRIEAQEATLERLEQGEASIIKKSQENGQEVLENDKLIQLHEDVMEDKGVLLKTNKKNPNYKMPRPNTTPWLLSKETIIKKLFEMLETRDVPTEDLKYNSPNVTAETILHAANKGTEITEEYMETMFSQTRFATKERAAKRTRRSSNPFSKPKLSTTNEAEQVITYDAEVEVIDDSVKPDNGVYAVTNH